MRALLSITMESSLRLMRDRIFLPTIVVGFCFILFATIASDWGIEEFEKILYDIGITSLQFVGSVIALFWGTNLISTSKGEGSIEVQLAAPISRFIWLLGKYLGLSSVLFIILIIFSILWQGSLFFWGFETFRPEDLIIFLMLYLSWLIMGAVAIFFSSLTSETVALFSGICFWIAGLISEPIAFTLPRETPELTRYIITTFSELWNLQLFNLSMYSSSQELPIATELFWRASYGIFLVGFFISLGTISFNRRELTS